MPNSVSGRVVKTSTSLVSATGSVSRKRTRAPSLRPIQLACISFTRSGQRSRAWLGVALLLGGIGAGLAGASYQAFSYPLKCAGWDFCRLTDGLEVGYSVSQAASVSAMVARGLAPSWMRSLSLSL